MKRSLSFLLRLIFFLLFWNANLIPCSATEDESDQASDADKKDNGVPRVFSLDELKVANGADSENLYLCIIGRVYDVAAGKEYYAPDGPYSVFVGRDAPGKLTPTERR